MGYLKDKIIFKIKRGGGIHVLQLISNLQMHKEILKLSCAVSNIDYKILINICTHNNVSHGKTTCTGEEERGNGKEVNACAVYNLSA